jgi:predicted amidohydrolase
MVNGINTYVTQVLLLLLLFFFFLYFLVFDENGNLITKYRKSHLFGTEKDCCNPGNESIVTFTSSFGVKFGLFICYDIAFEKPAVELVKNFFLIF